MPAKVSPLTLGAGVVCVVAAAVVMQRSRTGDAGEIANEVVGPARALAMLAVLAVGATPLAVLLVRSRLGAALDQGHPATWRGELP